ncbi:hypothetical protein E3G67_001443 [Mycobacteroides abscessus]|nr:hypothetical protein [Mycobacteroides abscessus]
MKLTAHVPTIVLIGGRYTTDGGDQLDSRQPFADDTHSSIPLKTLSTSELWWDTVSSLVLPLLEARGDDAVAKIGGPRTLMSPNPNGPVLRRRLAGVLPGGVRTPKKRAGRWRLVEMSQMWEDDEDAAVVVDTWGWYWFNAMSASDFAHFEKTWLSQDNLVIVAPHTHAATVFLDGYIQWVAEGRYPHTLDMPLPPYNWDLGQIPVVPIEADFHVTGVLQDGSWVDPAPLEAARALLQTRFDLRIGLWDLATNDTLRTTLLREAPVLAAPETVASRPSPVVAHEQRMKADRTPEQVERDDAWAAAAEVLKTLDAHGWTADLPDSAGNVDPDAKYTRSLPLAFVPELDPADDRPRHPALRPGKPILWLHCSFRPAVEHTVGLIVVPPTSQRLHYEIGMFFFDNRLEFESASAPYDANGVTSGGRRGVTFHSIARFGGPDPAGWQDRIEFIKQKTQTWRTLLLPVIDMCLQSIHEDPSGQIPEPDFPFAD